MVHPRTLIVARFALTIASLCYSVLERATNIMPGGAALEPLPEALGDAMWDRMAGLGRRFARLAARLEAGTLRIWHRRRFRAESAPARPGPASAVAPDAPPVRLPRGFGWFLRLSPHAHPAVAQMRLLLADPEMAVLVASHPAFGRVIRPLCHMLAVAPSAHLLALRPLPPRPRPARARIPRPGRTGERDAAPPGCTTTFGRLRSRRRCVQLE